MDRKNSRPPASDSTAPMDDLQRTLDALDHLLEDDSPSAAGDPVRPLVSEPPDRDESADQRVAGEVLPAEPAANTDGDGRDLELLTRFVAGALILGAEQLVEHARKWDEQAPRDIGPLAGGRPLEEASYGELARYFAIGLVTSSRRSAFRFARASLSAPGGLAASLLKATDRLTGSLLLRPLQRPLSNAIQRGERMSRDWIEEGWQEEQISRYVAANGIPDIVDEVIEVIVKNPELVALIKGLLGEQSLSMASSVVDTGRRLSVVGDDTAESIVRRILRRGVRAEMERIEPIEELPPLLRRAKVPADNAQG